MAGTLISYRGSDAPGHAGRLFDRLRARLPKQAVRKDVSQVAPGEDFVQAIEDAVESSDTVLVVIGRDWMGSNSQGTRWVDDPNDPVRLEIAAALQRKRRVIPILVGGAAMPSEQGLPSDIRGLVRYQAVDLRDASWDIDIDNLVAAISTAKRAVKHNTNRPRPRSVLIGVLLGVGVVGSITWLSTQSDSSDPAQPSIRVPPPGIRVHPDVTLLAHDDIGVIAALPGQRIASLKSDQVTVWSLASGESKSLYKEYGLASIAGLPDGRLGLAYWGHIKLLNVDTAKIDGTIELHDPYPDKTDTSIERLILLRDDTLLSFSGVSVGLCNWKTRAGHVIGIKPPNRFAVLNGQRLALLPPGGGVGVWNLRDPKAETLVAGNPDEGPEKDLAALPDGGIATTSEHAAITLWNLESGKQKTLRAPDPGGAWFGDRLFALPDGRLVDVREDSIEVWTVTRDRPDSVRKIATRRTSMAEPLLLADGRLILGIDDGGILLWNPQTSQSEAILEGHTKPVKQFLLLDDNRLASEAEDRTIRIWKLPSNTVRGAPLAAHNR